MKENIDKFIRKIKSFFKKSSPSSSEARVEKNALTFKQKSTLVVLFFFSFFTFLYLTFPYSTVNQILVSHLNQKVFRPVMHSNLSVEKLQPHWFTGIRLSNVVLRSALDVSIENRFSEIDARISILPLLIGKVTFTIDVKQANGKLEAYINSSLFSLLFSNNNPLSDVKVNFKNFELDDLFKQGIAFLKSSTNPTMYLFLPILNQTSLGGLLNGKTQLIFGKGKKMDIKSSAFQLEINKGYFNVTDLSLGIPKQEFSEFKILLTSEKNKINILKGTKIDAQNLGIDTDGILNMKSGTDSAITLKLKMTGNIEKNFGLIINNALSCKMPETATETRLIRLTGPYNNLSCM